jgi:two-component system NtrC family sensor kinase
MPRQQDSVERLDLRELLETALQMNMQSLNRHGHHCPRIPGYSSRPGRQAQSAADSRQPHHQRQASDERQPGKILTVGILAANEASVRIFVRDTGCGIANRKYDTRLRSWIHHQNRCGHGFGLHSSALAAREMKGSLTVHSDGPERARSSRWSCRWPHRFACGVNSFSYSSSLENRGDECKRKKPPNPDCG